jgi:hypothetical protein
MASCIKDEAPNAEADITGISFEEDVLASARFNLNPSYNDNLQAYPILVKVKEGTPLNKLSPLFELTPGATISPESGSEHDFSLDDAPVEGTIDQQSENTSDISADNAKPEETEHSTEEAATVTEEIESPILYENEGLSDVSEDLDVIEEQDKLDV